MSENEIESFCPAGKLEWRKWLQKNHTKKQSVWLICYQLKTGIPTISWAEAVEEALCFGWIDSKRKPIDKDKFMQFFSKRKARSTWSKVNKLKVQQLMDSGRMLKAGLEIIATAKENGSWTILDEVEELTIPKDLSAAFRKQPGSKAYFSGISKSSKKMILQWLVLAKRPETRQKRIDEVAELAARGMKPKHVN